MDDSQSRTDATLRSPLRVGSKTSVDGAHGRSQRLPVGRAVEVSGTVAVRRTDAGDGSEAVRRRGSVVVGYAVPDALGDRALGVRPGRPHVVDQPRVRVAEEVVDVPVAHVVFPARHPAVAFDAGEPAGAERAAGVGVPASGEVALAQRAERDGRRGGEFDEQRVGATLGHRHRLAATIAPATASIVTPFRTTDWRWYSAKASSPARSIFGMSTQRA